MNVPLADVYKQETDQSHCYTCIQLCTEMTGNSRELQRTTWNRWTSQKIAWNDMEYHGITRNNMDEPGMTRNNVEQHEIAWNYMEYNGIACITWNKVNCLRITWSNIE